MASPSSSRLSAIKLALLARQTRAQQADATILQSEPIAIVGMACRFPGGATSPDAFWRMLRDGVDAIARGPGRSLGRRRAVRSGSRRARQDEHTRWRRLSRPCRYASTRSFFGIAPREAASMDPQQRLLLEVAWEALERRRPAPQAALAGSADRRVRRHQQQRLRPTAAAADRSRASTPTPALGNAH